jgi:hypothetical protein
MNFRKITLLAASIAVLTPALSNASPEKSALNACAQAFATSLASSGAPTPSFKVAYKSDEFSASTVEFYNREFTFELHAKDAKTGAEFAHASCSTNSRGAVVALSSLPVQAAPATLASRF